MSKKNPNADVDDAPHTLRSDLPSNEIPICRPSHLSSLSLASNPLQISQSPTRGFVTQEHKSQCKMSGMKVDHQNKNSHCGPVPLDGSDLSHTTNQTESASNNFAETKSSGKEILFSRLKSDEQAKEQEHKRLPPTEDFSVSSCPPGNPSPVLSHEPSLCDDQSNPSCSSFSNIPFSPPEFVAQSPSASPSDTPPSLEFFSFVILHVPEDQEEARRVCGILHNLEIGKGTTFCEGFETAGVSPLRCLEDAVENCAYIVLLLTTGFLSKWGEFQTNTVLMNSIDDRNKSGTVIPFIPKFKTLIGKIPLTLKALIPLNEVSQLFKTQVRNTFKQNIIEREQERWKKEQELRTYEKRLEDAKDALEIQQRIAMSQQDVLCLFSQMSALLSNMPHQPGPVIQINNASNVQIGNQNSMNVQQTTNVPQMEMSGEYYQECDKEFQS